MRALAAVLCVATAGCDALFGLDHLDTTIDAAGTDVSDPRIDASDGDCLFQPRILLEGSGGSHDPTLSVDRKELFFVRVIGAGYGICSARRTDVNAPFDTALVIAELESSGDDTDPALTADGLMIVFKSDRGGNGPRAYQATRSSETALFSTPQLVPGLESTTVNGLDLSPDGLTLYYDDGEKLMAANRAARDQPVEFLSIVSTGPASFPSVSPDGLELYSNGSGIIQRTRSTLTAPFEDGTTTVIDAGGADGDIVADGSALVLTAGPASDIIYLRERCQ